MSLVPQVAFFSIISFSLYAAFLYFQPDGWFMIDSMVLVVGAIGGAGLGLLISNRLSLITFSVVAGVVDIYSVSGGLTSKLVENAKTGSSDLLYYLVVSIPWDGKVQPVVGIGDFFILAAICFAMIRMGYKTHYLLMAPLSGLIIALVIGLIVGGIYAIPFMALTTVLYLFWVNPLKK